MELKSSAGAEGQWLKPVQILVMLFTQKGLLNTSTLQMITLILHPTDQLIYGFKVSLVGFR